MLGVFRTLVMASSAMLCHVALSQPVEPDVLRNQMDSTPFNAFRFIGNHLVCKTNDPNTENPCYRIGEFILGDDFGNATKHFGKPWKLISQPDGGELAVFTIKATELEQAYWVIGNREGKIASVQLTGDFPSQVASFSTIRLSDPQSKVRDILGPRYSAKSIEAIKGTMWDYAPFQISIEFVNDKVYSIRIGT
jgi:hypothetical protein